MSTEPEKREAPKTLIQLVTEKTFRDRMAAVLPKHLDPDRMVKIAVNALNKAPKLKACTQNSFIFAMMQLSQLGLEPDGRQAHLIPYGDECKLIVDYKGIAELVMRSGLVSSIYADVIYEGDLFEWSMGDVSAFVPWWLRRDADKPSKKGDAMGAFCRIVFSDGKTSSGIMSREEIEQIKASSPGAKKPESPWNGPFWGEMWKKTVFKRRSKWLPWSSEIRDAFEADDHDAIDGEFDVIDGEREKTLGNDAVLKKVRKRRNLPAPQPGIELPEQSDEPEPEAEPVEAKRTTQPANVNNEIQPKAFSFDEFAYKADSCKSEDSLDRLVFEYTGPDSAYKLSSEQMSLVSGYLTKSHKRIVEAKR